MYPNVPCNLYFMVKFYARLNLGSSKHNYVSLSLWCENVNGEYVRYAFAGLVHISVSLRRRRRFGWLRTTSTFSFSHFMTMSLECVFVFFKGKNQTKKKKYHTKQKPRKKGSACVQNQLYHFHMSLLVQCTPRFNRFWFISNWILYSREAQNLRARTLKLSHFNLSILTRSLSPKPSTIFLSPLSFVAQHIIYVWQRYFKWITDFFFFASLSLFYF